MGMEEWVLGFCLALFNCQGHIKDGDGDLIFEVTVDSKRAHTHLPTQWLFYPPINKYMTEVIYFQISCMLVTDYLILIMNKIQ